MYMYYNCILIGSSVLNSRTAYPFKRVKAVIIGKIVQTAIIIVKIFRYMFIMIIFKTIQTIDF